VTLATAIRYALAIVSGLPVRLTPSARVEVEAKPPLSDTVERRVSAFFAPRCPDRVVTLTPLLNAIVLAVPSFTAVPELLANRLALLRWQKYPSPLKVIVLLP